MIKSGPHLDILSSRGTKTIHHCIVTPDLVGPIKNGGIGTHVYNLARALAHAGQTVTILFTGPIEVDTASRWQEWYKEMRIKLDVLSQATPFEAPVHATALHARSLQVYNYLRDKQFDQIHFQDWQANGFIPARAKAVLGEFSQTLLTLTLHSNTLWIAEGSQRWHLNPIGDHITAWAEAYVASHVDHVISPSKHMANWCESAGWKTRKEIAIRPYPLGNAQISTYVQPKLGEIAFFGRLETRKGLGIFLDALMMLNSQARAGLRHVHFVGKIDFLGSLRSDIAIKRSMAKIKIRYTIVSDKNSTEAIEYLRVNNATVFCPSLLDNFPFAILEAAAAGLCIQATRVGGIPEILDDTNLFEPTASALAKRLGEVLNGTSFRTKTLIDLTSLDDPWVRLSNEPIDPPPPALNAANEEPMVSVCVAYYNYGQYLPELIASLANQTYRNFEVIVIDDGSSDPLAISVFDELAANCDPDHFRFVRQKNQGIGATRNNAAALSRGDLLVFSDADNIAKPEMLELFVEAIRRTKSDIITCHFDGFRQDGRPKDQHDVIYTYLAVGPVIGAGWRENVFGDANCCFKKSVYQSIGGFTPMRNASWEDWELLARAVLAGHTLEVVPKSLFWYRHTEQGASRNTSLYRNQKRVLNAYLDAMPDVLRPAVEVMAQSTFQQSSYTPAGVLLARIADRIYVALGSPDNRATRYLESFFNRLMEPRK